jgi:UDP:flavonoid glycosyltransferase YjiC (YdhE family)
MPQTNLRILIAALGSHGDVHPFIGIAKELLRRGHDVTVLAPAIFERLMQSLELDYVSIGTVEQFESFAARPELWRPVLGIRVLVQGMLEMLQPYYRAIEQRHEPGRTVLVISSIAIGGRVAQEKLGIPAVSVHLSPAILRSVHQPARTPPLPVAPSLNTFRASLGLSPVKGIFRNWIHSPDRVIGLFPDWFAPAPPDWPKQTVTTGFPLYDESDVTPIDASLEEFLVEGDAPIAFTPGSAMRHGREFFAAAVETCRLLGRRGLLLSRFSEHIPANLPRGIRHVSYAPFSRLLPRCAAMIHHGGIGTTAQALAAGVPQVVVPRAHDQPDNAARLGRLGVGETVPANRFTASRACAALNRAMDGIHRAACAVVKQRFTIDNSLPRTVEWIERTR